jgi:hypothetical protein
MVPWTVRNAVQLDAFVPLTTHGGQSLYEGNWMLEEDDFLLHRGVGDARRRIRELQAGRGPLDEVGRDRLYRSEAKRIISSHPGRYVVLCLVRVARLWLNVGYGTRPGTASLGVAAVNGLLLAALVGGIVRRGRTWVCLAGPALMLVALNTLVYALTLAYVRYSFPVIPTVMALAAAAWFPQEKTQARTVLPASPVLGASDSRDVTSG